MLKIDSIVTAALSRMGDNSPSMRGKLVVWINELIQSLGLWDWKFLEKEQDLPVTDNKVPLPSDFARVRFIRGSDFFLSPMHKLSPEDAFNETRTNGTTVKGFTEDSESFTLVPSGQGSVTVGYYRTIPEYLDSDTTIVPLKFKPLMVRSLLSAYYEYDVDERAVPSLSLDQKDLDAIRAEENRQKPFPKVKINPIAGNRFL